MNEVDVTGGKLMRIDANQLFIGDEEVASWTANIVPIKSVALKFNDADITSGTTLYEAGTLTLSIINEKGHTSTVQIVLTNDGIYGLESLQSASLQVDEETNLLSGITLADGVEMVKVEVVIDGVRYDIPDANHYTPQYPGTCTIIITLKTSNGNIVEVKVDNLTIKPLDYKAIDVTNIKPVDILPFIGQVEA